MTNSNVPETSAVKAIGYYYDISIPEHAEQYQKIVDLMKSRKVVLWDIHHTKQSKSFNFSNSGQIIDIETKCLFANQWNTRCGKRVFEWSEIAYPNKNIKKGYYLVLPPEFDQLLKDTFKCGYCGHQYHKPEQKWCDKCLGSEHLKEHELWLLRLKPLRGAIPKLEVPDELKEKYRVAQEKATVILCNKEMERLRENYKKTERDNGIEFRAKIWLLEHNIPLDNFIFYKHTQKLTFGWRTPLNENQIESLKLKLNGFPFPKMLDFKVA